MIAASTLADTDRSVTMVAARNGSVKEVGP